MFKFRLQKVLDHRAGLEQEAKQAFLEARKTRLDGENEILELSQRRQELRDRPVESLVARIELEAQFMKVDDHEIAARIALGVLLDEESAAEDRWKIRKHEHEAVVKLREKGYKEWLVEETRKEQAGLDEWAVLRRSTAQGESA